MKSSKQTPMLAATFMGLCLALSACGKKPESSPASGPGKPVASDSYWKHEPVGKLGQYTGAIKLHVLTDRLNEAWWREFRVAFVKALAADKELADGQLAAVAFEDVGREPDPFKREDKIKARSEELAALRKSATPRIHVVWGEDLKDLRDSNTAAVLPYDMASETYKVQILTLDRDEQGYNFRRASIGREIAPVENLAVAFTAPGSLEMTKKVPKDLARAIEAKLAPLRAADPKSSVATVPFSAYATVMKTEKPPAWSDAKLNLWVDAVALHMPDAPSSDAFMVLDGDDFAPTYRR